MGDPPALLEIKAVVSRSGCEGINADASRANGGDLFVGRFSGGVRAGLVAVQVLFAGLGPESKEQNRCHQSCGEQALHGVNTGTIPILGTPSWFDAWGSRLWS